MTYCNYQFYQTVTFTELKCQGLSLFFFLPLKKQKNDVVMKGNQLYCGRICNPRFLMFGLHYLWAIPFFFYYIGGGVSPVVSMKIEPKHEKYHKWTLMEKAAFFCPQLINLLSLNVNISFL